MMPIAPACPTTTPPSARLSRPCAWRASQQRRSAMSSDAGRSVASRSTMPRCWLAESRGLVEASSLAPVPKPPSPRGARPRPDIRPRMLAALAAAPATVTAIFERAGLPVRERVVHATRARARLEADGFAARSGTAQVPRRSAAPLLSRQDLNPIAQRDRAGRPIAPDPYQPPGPTPSRLGGSRSLGVMHKLGWG